MRANWRYGVIPLTVLLCITLLWLPLPGRYEEATFAHADQAVIHLASPASQASEAKTVSLPVEKMIPPSPAPFPTPDKALLPLRALKAPAPPADLPVPTITELSALLPPLPTPSDTPAAPEKTIEAGEPEDAGTDAPSLPEEPGEQTVTNPVPDTASAERIASTHTDEVENISVGYAEMDGDTTAPTFNTKELSKRIVYPPAAKRQRITGDVLLVLYISDTGMVDRVDILEDPGYGFGEAAKVAFLGLKGEPAMRNGKPIAVMIRYPIRFSLR
jgi:protein TonB